MNQNKPTPLQIELAKLLSVLKADRTMITDRYLSITPVEERPEWLDAIAELENYIKSYEQNKKLALLYEKYKARKAEQK